MRGGDADQCPQELRREVGPVRPNNGVEFRVKLQALEVLDAAQWLEDLPLKLAGQVNLAFGPIDKPQPDRVACNVSSF